MSMRAFNVNAPVSKVKQTRNFNTHVKIYTTRRYPLLKQRWTHLKAAKSFEKLWICALHESEDLVFY